MHGPPLWLVFNWPATLTCTCPPASPNPNAGWTAPGLVALEAHSAGGLTAGALLNRRAADVGAALLEAPFVDVLTAMSDASLPLTVHEYEEWGDPRQADAFERASALGFVGRAQERLCALSLCLRMLSSGWCVV